MLVNKISLEKDHLLIIAYGTDSVLISLQDGTVDCTLTADVKYLLLAATKMGVFNNLL